MITETEAYHRVADMASYAYGGRYTKRAKIYISPARGRYVYLCYGINSLFNIITNRRGIPHAILIPAIQPIDGIEKILARLGKKQLTKETSNGLGKVSEMLGVNYRMSGLLLT